MSTVLKLEVTLTTEERGCGYKAIEATCTGRMPWRCCMAVRGRKKCFSPRLKKREWIEADCMWKQSPTPIL